MSRIAASDSVAPLLRADDLQPVLGRRILFFHLALDLCAGLLIGAYDEHEVEISLGVPGDGFAPARFARLNFDGYPLTIFLQQQVGVAIDLSFLPLPIPAELGRGSSTSPFASLRTISSLPDVFLLLKFRQPHR